jgi:TPR repeat protein
MRTVPCPGCREPLTIDPSAGPIIACEHCGKTIRLTPPKPAAGKSPAPSRPATPAKSAATKSTEKKSEAISAKPKSTSAVSAKALGKSAKSIRVVDDNADEYDDTPRPKKKKKKATSPWYWVGLGAAGLFVIVAVGILVMKLSSRSSSKPAEAAQIAKLPDRPQGKEPLPIDPALKQLAEQDEEDEAAAEKSQGKGTRPINPKHRPVEVEPLPDDPITIIGENLGFEVPVFDEAAFETKRKAKFEWNRRTLVDPYDRIGKKNSNWDADAKEALESAARMFSASSNPSRNEWKGIRDAAFRAMAAGCDDPMIKHLAARGGGTPDEIIESGLTLEKSAYPAMRRTHGLKFTGLAIHGVNGPPPEEMRERFDRTEKIYERMIPLLQESARDFPDRASFEGFSYEILFEASALALRRRSSFPLQIEWIDEVIKKHPSLKGSALKVRARFMTIYAWEARGSGPAAAVTPQAFQVFGQRMLEARKNLTDAWRLNSRDGMAAAMMILNLKAIGGGDISEVKVWFDKAMKADPDNQEACANLLDYLDPRWHGTPEALIAFGRACMRSNNYRSKIPLLIVDAHYRAILFNDPNEWNRYLHTEAVWKDVKSVYDEYFKYNPDDVGERCKFATMSYHCGKYKISSEQFQLAGPNLASNSAFSNSEMMEARNAVYLSFPPPAAKGAKKK